MIGLKIVFGSYSRKSIQRMNKSNHFFFFFYISIFNDSSRGMKYTPETLSKRFRYFETKFNKKYIKLINYMTNKLSLFI